MSKEVEVNNKRHARIRSWAFAVNGISPMILTLLLSLIFPYSSAAPLPQVSSLLAGSGQFLVGLVLTISSLRAEIEHSVIAKC